MNISNSLLNTLRNNPFANPFKSTFDLDVIISENSHELSSDDKAMFSFLIYCNEIYQHSTSEIFKLFDLIDLKPDDLREFLFISINQLTLAKTTNISNSYEFKSNDLERLPFLNFVDFDNNNVGIEAMYNLLGDVLNTLIKISYQWKPKGSLSYSLDKIHLPFFGDKFYKLWLYSNALVNISESAYPIILFENGNFTLSTKHEFKIESEFQVIPILKMAGEIRSQRARITLLSFVRSSIYHNTEQQTGFKKVAIKNNKVIFRSSERHMVDNKILAHSDILNFHPYLFNVPLQYFDNLSISDITNITLLIETLVSDFTKSTADEYNHKDIHSTPSKFNYENLVSELAKISKKSKPTIKKILNSLIANGAEDNIWRKPFIKIKDHIYFGIATSSAPQHNNYFDLWTNINGYTSSFKQTLFKEYIIERINESNQELNTLRLKDLKEYGLSNTEFEFNILLENDDVRLLIEVYVFDYPLDSFESQKILDNLIELSASLELRAKNLDDNQFENSKTTVKVIINNYTLFSGVQINDVSVADLLLLENYLFVGSLKRASINVSKNHLLNEEGPIIHYYKTKEEFSNNLPNFFKTPFPIIDLVKRFNFVEKKITPPDFTPAFIISVINHLSDPDLTQDRLDDLSFLLNQEYYFEDRSLQEQHVLEDHVMFKLYDIFQNLSFGAYNSFAIRRSIKENLDKDRFKGLVHLNAFLLHRLKKLNGKPIKSSIQFVKIQFDADTTLNILSEKLKRIDNKINFTDLNIEENTFSEIEEKEIISFIISFFDNLSQDIFSEELIETAIDFCFVFYQFSRKYNLHHQLYNICSIITDLLNHNNKFQKAVDFSEVILSMSINDDHHTYGWNNLFRCYLNQDKIYDSFITGSIFISCLESQPNIPDFLHVEIFYNLIKLFRNTGLPMQAESVFEISKSHNFEKYDELKITLAYYNTIYKKGNSVDTKLVEESIRFMKLNFHEIINYKKKSIVPWLNFFYNVVRFYAHHKTVVTIDIEDCIQILEDNLDPKIVVQERARIFGSKEQSKGLFINAMLNSYETRQVVDFLHESQRISLLAHNLLSLSCENEDIDGILLAGLVINDQTLAYSHYSVGSRTGFLAVEHLEKIKFHLENFFTYITDNIRLKPKQLLVWLFEISGIIYSLSFNSALEYNLTKIPNWDFLKMNHWVADLRSFYFNSKKGIFNNQKEEMFYEFAAQEEDLKKLQNYLAEFKLQIPFDTDEVLLLTSISMSSFPHNLLLTSGSLLGHSLPCCNILSLDQFNDQYLTIHLEKNYSVSAWIPVNDQEYLISWGYKLLLPTLSRIEAKISTTTYPAQKLTSDINIFLAHGATDKEGFKLIYTNEQEGKVVTMPRLVFGTGRIAILFICNSGFSKEATFSNSLVSLTQELINSGYSSVIAPFWPFDVTMSKIWLDDFLDSFNKGFSLNESVWLANNRLTKFDQDTSNVFLAPAGSLAMHLFGNPNICVNVNS